MLLAKGGHKLLLPFPNNLYLHPDMNNLSSISLMENDNTTQVRVVTLEI